MLKFKQYTIRNALIFTKTFIRISVRIFTVTTIDSLRLLNTSSSVGCRILTYALSSVLLASSIRTSVAIFIKTFVKTFTKTSIRTSINFTSYSNCCTTSRPNCCTASYLNCYIGEGTPQLKSIYYFFYGSPLLQLRLSFIPLAATSTRTSAVRLGTMPCFIKLYVSIIA